MIDGDPRIGSLVFPRRRLLELGAVAVAAGLAASPRTALAFQPPPLARPTPPDAVYAPKSGHHISGPFLRWWLQNDGESILGWPVSEPEEIGGKQVQFFQRGALSNSGADPVEHGIEPMHLGRTWGLENDPQALAPGAGDRSSVFWFGRTGRGVHPAFWQSFVDGGGAGAFGYPISGVVAREGGRVQLFTRARLRLTESGVGADPLGYWEASRLGVATRPVPRNESAPVYSPMLFSEGFGDPNERRVEVDLPRQVTTFFQGDRVVRRSVVSTGRVPGWTPNGMWRIFLRKLDERMVGGQPGTTDFYDLTNVYFTQYFTTQWHALHYAWWHDEFGTVQSHGCVNLKLADADWAWRFCSRDTPVVIRNTASESEPDRPTL